MTEGVIVSIISVVCAVAIPLFSGIIWLIWQASQMKANVSYLCETVETIATSQPEIYRRLNAAEREIAIVKEHCCIKHGSFSEAHGE